LFLLWRRKVNDKCKIEDNEEKADDGDDGNHNPKDSKKYVTFNYVKKF
jgi:hypothetical protein